MEVKFFCPRWGSEDIAWDTFLQKVQAAGFKGIEWFPDSSTPAEITQVLQLLKKYQLDYAIVMSVGPASPVATGFETYSKELKDRLIQYSEIGIELIRPLFISVQMGREYYTNDQIDACLDICASVQSTSGVAIYQETHRNKWSYAAHTTAAVLNRHPALKLTLDISHWFCVSESYLQDQTPAVNLAITRTRHLHARVGHTQGSQVPDFEWPDYQEALQAHLNIWDRWIRQCTKSNLLYCTITPEFGPWPYLIDWSAGTTKSGSGFGADTGTGTHTGTDRQWDLNTRMMRLLDQRYNH